jgi:hypothetical protein
MFSAWWKNDDYKVDAKTFMGKDIIHIAIFDKSDKRTIYYDIQMMENQDLHT